ncbi:hypothetical protein VME0621_01972 [Vibrio mediterranei]|jgi:hypothetical protein|uniref:hypothetical protein n=1 Tax=Vibrio mediterranei TaxID=689 RepID=UPI0007F3D45E|nr:hypothetical protein [Vibrio mediterranei]SBO09869.1 hypothetical protein VME0621_01972 [Vibrio mediterranei]
MNRATDCSSVFIINNDELTLLWPMNSRFVGLLNTAIFSLLSGIELGEVVGGH